MAKIKYDLSDVEDITQAHAPVGVYRAKIEGVDGPKPSSSGNTMLEVRFALTHDAAGKSLNGQFMPVWYYPLLSEDAHPVSKARTKEFFLALGMKPKGTLDTDKLEGQSVQLRLKTDSDQDGEYRPKIGKVMALPEQDEPDEEEPDEPDVEAEEEDDGPDLDAMDRSELKALIKEEGLDVKVLKKMSDDDIRKAIVEAWPEDEEEPEDEADEEEEEDEEEEAEEDEDEDDGYDTMAVADLKKELKERELPTNGAKKVLIARLRKDDGEEPF